ncbi:MAG: glycosyltransferase family 4 protein [Pseudomonadota bacterium]|nr:glycosyltransferase family 4 protein [Pseudomonadota bacterium]
MLRPLTAKPRRVLMSTDAVGGVWTYALELAAGLAGEGVETVLVGLGPRPDEAQERAARQVVGLDLRWLDLPLDWLAEDEARFTATVRALSRLAEDTGAGLVHLNAPAQAAGFEVDVPLVVAAHSCLATWWKAVKTGAMPEDWGWRVRLTAEGLRRADLVLAPSRAFGAALESCYGPLRVSVVHNGRDLRRKPAPKGRFVLTAGRLWDEGKNLTTLDAAADGLSWPVTAAGALQGPTGSRVRLRHMALLGALPESAVARLCAEAPIFASLALYEPFGLAVLEAAQAGAALVLSDIPTFRELWDGAALFVPPRDATATRDALEGLIADERRRRALQDAARRQATRFTPQLMTESMLAAYAQALAAPRPALPVPA